MAELPPTEKRLREARAEGAVAVSPLGIWWGALVGATIGVVVGFRPFGAHLLVFSRSAWGGTTALSEWKKELATLARTGLLPVGLGAWLGALASGLGQTRGLLTWRAVGRAGRGQVGIGAVAWTLVAGAAALALLSLKAIVALGRSFEVNEVVHATVHLGRTLGLRLLVLIGLGAVVEYAWLRLRLRAALRMTRAERERERRQEEGDPRLRRERQRRQRRPSA